LKTKCKNKKGERRDEKKAPKTKESQCEKKAYTRNKVRESNRKGAHRPPVFEARSTCKGTFAVSRWPVKIAFPCS
jgi:hypothetical protein